MRAVPDILAVIGAALLTTGASLVYAPAGFIVAGVLCIVGARMANK